MQKLNQFIKCRTISIGKIILVINIRKSTFFAFVPTTIALGLLYFYPDPVGAMLCHKSTDYQQFFNFQTTIKFAS